MRSLLVTRAQPVRAPRRALVALALAGSAALLLGGCQTSSRSLTANATGSISQSAPSAGRPAQLAELEQRYAADPADAAAGLAYGNALRATGQRAQATAVLQQTAIKNPRDTRVLGAYGRALAENGQLQQSLDVLARAHTPDRPDWRILNVQGAVLDQMGRPEEARKYYETALKIAPDEPTILANLGLSYALSKNLPQAEATLRQAAASPKADLRVRQNLALVLSLQGRMGEAEQLARADLSPEEAQASVAAMRRLAAAGGAKPQGGSTVATTRPAARGAVASGAPQLRSTPAAPDDASAPLSLAPQPAKVAAWGTAQ
ncbi:tetratricopeptide repeat protein [Ancylobacter terrae]|uniref:tetratricopeptide repeat protein n=1 Tax=Ancylobacter sp. sgz301288 TaxID=3342077 RepID=UPI00385A6EDA